MLDRLWPVLRPSVCILDPGDAVFFPCNHYHLTLNIGDTVAVGGVLDSAAAADADRCTRDIYATAAGIVATPLDTSPSARETTCANSGSASISGGGDCGHKDGGDEDTTAINARAEIRSKREIASRLLPFSVEASVKWGVLLAQDNELAAAKYFSDAAARFSKLHELGVLEAVPLAVILDVLAEYCSSQIPKLQKFDNFAATALQIARNAVRYDPCNARARATLTRLSPLSDRPAPSNDIAVCAHEDSSNTSISYQLKSISMAEPASGYRWSSKSP